MTEARELQTEKKVMNVIFTNDYSNCKKNNVDDNKQDDKRNVEKMNSVQLWRLTRGPPGEA